MTKTYKVENYEIKVKVLKKETLLDFFEWTNEELQLMIDENGFDETVQKLNQNGYELNITINGRDFARSTSMNPDTEEYEIEPIKIVLDKGDGYESLGSYIMINIDNDLNVTPILHESVSAWYNGQPDHIVHSHWVRSSL